MAIRICEQNLESPVGSARSRPARATEAPLTSAATQRQPTLTDEEVAHRLAALHRASILRAELLARRRGTPLPSSVDLIQQIREELSERP
jgi:hypothetical protein